MKNTTKIIITVLTILLFIGQASASIEVAHIGMANVFDIVEYNNWLYAGHGTEIRSYNLSNLNLSNMTYKNYSSVIDLDYFIYGVWINESEPDYLYVSNTDGFFIVNISNPVSLSVVGSLILPTGHDARDIETKGNYAYIASYGKGIVTVNITNKSAPTLINTYPLSGYNQPLRLNISGDYIYVALDTDNRLDILDISNPSSPSLVGNWTVNQSTNGLSSVSVLDNYAFVVLYNHGVYSINVSDKTTPFQESFLGNTSTLAFNANDIKIYNSSYAFVSTRYEGFRIINISNPLSLSYYKNITGTQAYSESISISKSKNYVFSAMESIGFDISDTSVLLASTKINTVYTIGGYDSIDVTDDGNYLFIGAHNLGVWSFNVTNKSNPVISGFLYTAGRHPSVIIQGNYLYASSDWTGMNIINISVPSNMSLGKKISGNIDYGLPDDDYLYLSEYNLHTLPIYNISIPAAPTLISNANLNNTDSRDGAFAKINDYYNFIATKGGERMGLHIINVTNRSNISLDSTFMLGTGFGDVNVNGTLAIAVTDYNIYSLNISNLSNIVEYNNLSYIGSFGFRDVEIWKNDTTTYVYAAGTKGMRIFNVTSDNKLELYATHDLPDIATGIVRVGSYLYVADNKHGFYILDANISSNVEEGTPGGQPYIPGNNDVYYNWNESVYGIQLLSTVDVTRPIYTGNNVYYGIDVQVSQIIDRIKIREYLNVGTPPTANFSVRLESDNNGNPSGNLLTTDSEGTAQNVSNAWLTVLLNNSNVSINKSTRVWLNISIDAGNSSNYYRIHHLNENASIYTLKDNTTISITGTPVFGFGNATTYYGQLFRTLTTSHSIRANEYQGENITTDRTLSFKNISTPLRFSTGESALPRFKLKNVTGYEFVNVTNTTPITTTVNQILFEFDDIDLPADTYTAFFTLTDNVTTTGIYMRSYVSDIAGETWQGSIGYYVTTTNGGTTWTTTATRDLSFQFNVTEASYSVSGYVLDENGIGISGANVEDNATGFSNITLLNGSYTISTLASGGHRFTATRIKYDYNYTDTYISQSNLANINITLSPSKYIISGTVKHTNGTGITGVYVVDNQSVSSDYTEPDGTYSLGQNYLNGMYNITFTKSGYVDNYLIVDINDSNNVTANVVLEEQDEVFGSPVALLWNNSKTNNDNLTGIELVQYEHIFWNVTFNQTGNISWYYDLDGSGGVKHWDNNTDNASWEDYYTVVANNKKTRAMINTAYGTANVTWTFNVTAPKYNISGYVNDSFGAAISTVSVVNGTNSTNTNATGYYVILMSNGTYNFSYSKTGYVTGYKEITIAGADVVNQNVTLTANVPNITSWGNNITNNANLTLTINTSESINFNATVNQTITTWLWAINGTDQSVNYDNFIISWATVGSRNVSVNATNVNGTSNTVYWNVTVQDITPPSSITGLTNVTGNFWHNWTWTNPTDSDFSHTMIYINGSFVTNTSNKYYNLTANAHNQSTISTRTVDIVGNVNQTWVNHTSIIPNNVPANTTLLTPTNGSTITSIPTNLTWNIGVDNDSDVLTYDLRVNGSTVIIGITTNYTLYNLSSGNNNWSVRSYDGYEYSNWSNIYNVTAMYNLVNFSFTNKSVSETQIYQSSQSTRIKVDVNDSDGYITNVSVGITFNSVQTNYTMTGGNDTWIYDFKSGVPGVYSISNFYATDNKSGINSSTSTLQFIVVPVISSGTSGTSSVTQTPIIVPTVTVVKTKVIDDRQPIKPIESISGLLSSKVDEFNSLPQETQWMLCVYIILFIGLVSYNGKNKRRY